MKAKFLSSQVMVTSSLICLLLSSAPAENHLHYNASFEITLKSGEDNAEASISLDQEILLARELRFRMNPERFSVLDVDGESQELDEDQFKWRPTQGNASLHYQVAVTQPRGRGFDGLVTDDWALFRGDDVFPPAWMEFEDGARSRSRLIINLPKDWKAVTPYPGDEQSGWLIDNPKRSFDRPTGWILAGRLGIRREEIADIKITIASPIRTGTQRVAMLALLRWNLPWLANEAPVLPERVLVVSGPDPMWRGGLSGPGSLFVHGDLPMISEDGTSPLLHEMCHVLFPVNAAWEQDWIDEGLAEYLSLRVLKETGTISKSRYRRSIKDFRDRGQSVSSLDGSASKGDVTARAVVLFHDLDAELSEATDGEADMMVLTRQMMSHENPLSLSVIDELSGQLLGSPPESLAAFRR